jgi:hypothetical protein
MVPLVTRSNVTSQRTQAEPTFPPCAIALVAPTSLRAPSGWRRSDHADRRRWRHRSANPIVRSRLSAFADRIAMRSRDGRDPCRRHAAVFRIAINARVPTRSRELRQSCFVVATSTPPPEGRDLLRAESEHLPGLALAGFWLARGPQAPSTRDLRLAVIGRNQPSNGAAEAWPQRR